MLMIKWGGGKGGGHKQTWSRPSSHSDSARDVQNNKCTGASWDSRYLAKWTLLHFSQCSCSWQIIKQVRKKKVLILQERREKVPSARVLWPGVCTSLGAIPSPEQPASGRAFFLFQKNGDIFTERAQKERERGRQTGYRPLSALISLDQFFHFPEVPPFSLLASNLTLSKRWHKMKGDNQSVHPGLEGA